MTTKIQGKGTRATRAGQLIAGARKRFPNGSQKLTLGGALGDVTVDAVVAGLQQLIDDRATVTAAQATARDKVQAERAAAPSLVALMNAFESFIRFMYSADSTVLADYGLPPRKQRAPLTAEQKAVAAAKRKATRAARGTTSAKAKRAIKGNVTAQVVVTPANAAQAAAPVATPPATAPATAPGGAAAAPPKG
ncbi:MAG TPA: hypothetical protein VIF09_05555 [Polyangiaceae bacterium]|jgi:hypothetical protein